MVVFSFQNQKCLTFPRTPHIKVVGVSLQSPSSRHRRRSQQSRLRFCESGAEDKTASSDEVNVREAAGNPRERFRAVWFCHLSFVASKSKECSTNEEEEGESVTQQQRSLPTPKGTKRKEREEEGVKVGVVVPRSRSLLLSLPLCTRGRSRGRRPPRRLSRARARACGARS